MTRKLLLTQKQITAICKGASKAGFVPIIETQGGISVRFVPASDDDQINYSSNEHVDANVRIRF